VETPDIEIDALQPQSRARLELLAAKGWTLAGEHPLSALHGRRLGHHRLLVMLGPKNNVGSRYFQLFIANSEGGLANESLALGLHNSGPYPAFNWLELIQYRSILKFGDSTLDLAPAGLDATLFALLSGLVPAGGHLMVEYDSPTQRLTERILTRGYPQAASPLGFLMFRAGCRSYHDWYISEGGREGPRKLQGFKPFNAEIASEKTAALRRQLEEFLAQPDTGQDEWRALARRLGRAVLDTL